MTKLDMPWDKIADKADEIIERLIKDGHSGQDIMFIGTRLIHAGVYVETREASEYVKANPWED